MNSTADANTNTIVAPRVGLITFKTSQGAAVQATALHLLPQSVSFEIYTPQCVVRVSEALADFRIMADDRAVYTGRAIVSSVVSAGGVTICEVALSGSLPDLGLFPLRGEISGGAAAGYRAFEDRWQKYCRILPEYKLAVADMQNYLEELRLWLEQVELGVRAMPAGDRAEVERNILRELFQPTRPALDAVFERFERVAATVPAELLPAHRAFCQRQLHPTLMCCPFMYRIYAKPLGYAGDYEMMNMINRNEYEGGSLFAKLLQAFILDTAPAHAVRNRVTYFTQRIVEETGRVSHTGRTANICSLGCGPAREVENFLTAHPLSDKARFQLLDFNNETLDYTGNRLETVRRQHGRQTPVTLVKKSVHALLKDMARPMPAEQNFDLIYCSGLYDYLSDRVCKSLNTQLYSQLRPGGALVVTNFDSYTPIRNLMEHAYEWYLIYRNGRQFAQLAPEQAAADDFRVVAEASGCNIFLEVRKPLEA